MPKRLSTETAISKAFKAKQVKEPSNKIIRAPKPKHIKSSTPKVLRAKFNTSKPKTTSASFNLKSNVHSNRKYLDDILRRYERDKIRMAKEKERAEKKKLIEQKRAEREAKRRERRSVYYKRKKQIQKYAAKALALNEKTQEMVDNFRRRGCYVSNTKQLQDVKERILKALQNEKPPQRVVDLIKEYSKENTYDYIKVDLPIRTKEKLSDGEVDTADWLEVSFKEIRLARRRQVLSPDKITDKEGQILARVGESILPTQVSALPDEADEEQIEQFKKKFNKVRDISIGGNSMLINDLSYTYDALWEGRRFVENMQKIMSDPKEFVRIEAWYRSDEEEAEKARSDIGSAIKSDWYEKFKDFSATIIEFINKLPSLSKESEDRLNSYSDTLEVSADEVSGF